MGGSSFLFTCASIGIILSVARNIEGQTDQPAVATADLQQAKEKIAGQ
jgi:cell division protein FtsW